MQLNRAGPREVVVPTDEVLEPWADQIEQWLKQDKLKLTRIQDLLAQRQCLVAYTCLRRYVIRRGWFGQKLTYHSAHGGYRAGGNGRGGFRPSGADVGPGEWSQASGLGNGNRAGLFPPQFLWPLFGQQLADVIEGLEATWAFFGGIPRYLVLDNFPAAVVGADPLNPRLTRGFLEYAQHRGFIADPARPGHPKDKPKVERGMCLMPESASSKAGSLTGLLTCASRRGAGVWR